MKRILPRTAVDYERVAEAAVLGEPGWSIRILSNDHVRQQILRWSTPVDLQVELLKLPTGSYLVQACQGGFARYAAKIDIRRDDSGLHDKPA